MKVILSRKGFDSANGGYPSPILPDGSMISLPIPDHLGVFKYSDLRLNGFGSYYDLLSQLRKYVKEKTKIPLTSITTCHLDPDIDTKVISRLPYWRPIFGQNRAAQGHLNKERVGEGDLFLFFGLFQRTVEKQGRLKFDSSDKRRHIIFGYLQIGKK